MAAFFREDVHANDTPEVDDQITGSVDIIGPLNEGGPTIFVVTSNNNVNNGPTGFNLKDNRMCPGDGIEYRASW